MFLFVFCFACSATRTSPDNLAMEEEALSDISLPDSVAESECHRSKSDPDPDSISLPPDVNDVDESLVHGSESCCKKGNCPQKFALEDLEAYKMEFQSCSQSQRLAKVFEKVKAIFQASGSDKEKNMAWAVLGQNVCRRFFESTHGIGHGALDKLVMNAKHGQLALPERGPRLARHAPQLASVDSWFQGLYLHLAEPLAIAGCEGRAVGIKEGESEHEVVDSVHPLYSMSLGTIDFKKGPHGEIYVPKRYLNFINSHQVWQFYQADEEVHQQVAKTTFKKSWDKWNKIMPLKDHAEGSKCNICARLTQERSEAVEPADRRKVDAEKQQHLDIVMADRQVSVKCNKLAALPSVWQRGKNHSSIAKLMIDGMDQCKFSLPKIRQAAGTSFYSKCWKPSIHVTGVILFGQLEYYAIMRPTTAKDSNMNSTIVARTLDIMAEKLQHLGEEYSFPSDLAPRWHFVVIF